MHTTQITRICRRVVAKDKFGGIEKKITDDPWGRIIYEFAQNETNQPLTEEQIEVKFRGFIQWAGL